MMTVSEARERRVCRVCGGPIDVTGPAGWSEDFGELVYPVAVTLDFGLEFAHTACLKGATPAPDSRPPFDPDFSPGHPVNRCAAEASGLRYDPVDRVYRDEDGCPVRDRFGQLF